ncbi:DUF2637 domain-containing protein [Nonomuraea sp. B19D2]|uniref:DUF2637 domain-containing protein n=1 Tax=Nonomuraea sp. B19D2 TaxID=3159561 RepID=UPI0032DA5D05
MPSVLAASADAWIRRTTTTSVVLVAGIAAVVSYQHMHELAIRNGESWLGATLIPLAVDGMIVASSMSVLHASRCGRRGGVLPWVLLVVGSLASLAANVAIADPTLTARVIAAWPSFALIGAYEMLMGQIRQSRVAEALAVDDTESELCLSASAFGEEERTEPTRERAQELHRLAWRWAQNNCRPDGRLPSGKAIAEQFSRSDRWGRWIKRAGCAGRLELAAGDGS